MATYMDLRRIPQSATAFVAHKAIGTGQTPIHVASAAGKRVFVAKVDVEVASGATAITASGVHVYLGLSAASAGTSATHYGSGTLGVALVPAAVQAQGEVVRGGFSRSFDFSGTRARYPTFTTKPTGSEYGVVVASGTVEAFTAWVTVTGWEET